MRGYTQSGAVLPTTRERIRYFFFMLCGAIGTLGGAWGAVGFFYSVAEYDWSWGIFLLGVSALFAAGCSFYVCFHFLFKAVKGLINN